MHIGQFKPHEVSLVMQCVWGRGSEDKIWLFVHVFILIYYLECIVRMLLCIITASCSHIGSVGEVSFTAACLPGVGYVTYIIFKKYCEYFSVCAGRNCPFSLHFSLKSASLVWDSHIMLIFPMVAQSTHHVQFHLLLLTLSPPKWLNINNTLQVLT